MWHFIVLIILIIVIASYYIAHNLTFYHPKKSLEYYEKLNWNSVVENFGESNSNQNPTVKFLFSYSYKNDILPKYFKESRKMTNEYCKANGYELVEINHKGTSRLSPYWLRVYDMIKMTQSMRNGDIIVYLDMDATVNLKYKDTKITDLLHTIDTIVGKKFDIYVGSDPAGARSNYNMVFNTGVIIFRVSDWSRNFLLRWFKRYKHSLWRFNKGAWECRDNFDLICPWASLDGAYEQASFNILFYMNQYRENDKICKLHYSVLSNWFKNSDAFIYHLMGTTNTDRYNFFSSLSKKYNL